MNRIAILSNAGSGRNRRRSELLRRLDAASDVDHVVTDSAEAVPEALATLLGREPSVLAVNGGDGTLQAVLTVLADLVDAGAVPATPVPIAVLPAGSTNMSAHDLGCGGRLQRRLGDLLALRDRDREAWRVTFRRPLQIHDAADRRRIGFFFGMGTIVRGIEYWHERLRHGGGAGEWSAGAALARAAWGVVRRQPPFDAPSRLRLQARGSSSAMAG
ncbi:MAG: diacylglycerol kinase family protein, partial [Pseudomonadales bacterium]|nr:diacylglycerol kinase family protein [Pseudomonadales bacterium]